MTNNTSQIGTALALAFGEISNAIKNSQNPHFKSTYADLGAVLETVREAWKKYGLSVVQFPGELKVHTLSGESKLVTVSIHTTIVHSSGELMGSVLEMPVAQDKNGRVTPHAVGSALTFGRRYALAAVAGITQQDDDGNAGSDGEESEDTDDLSQLRDSLTFATTRDILRGLKPLVEASGDAELVELFKTRWKEYK